MLQCLVLIRPSQIQTFQAEVTHKVESLCFCFTWQRRQFLTHLFQCCETFREITEYVAAHWAVKFAPLECCNDCHNLSSKPSVIQGMAVLPHRVWDLMWSDSLSVSPNVHAHDQNSLSLTLTDYVVFFTPLSGWWRYKLTHLVNYDLKPVVNSSEKQRNTVRCGFAVDIITAL